MNQADWLEDDYESKLDLKLWRKLLAYTLQYRGTAAAFTSIALGLAGSDLCFPVLTGRVIADVQEHGRDANLLAYAEMFAGLTAVLCCCIWGFIKCAGKIRTHVSHDIRRDAFEQLQQLSFSFYDTKSVGWLMARLTSDCQRLSNILAWGVMDFIWGTALMAGISVVMVVYNWRLALAVLAVVPVLFGVSLIFRHKILRTSRLVRKTNSRITSAYNEGIVGVTTSKVFAREAENLRDFDRLIDEMRVHSVHNAVLSAVYLPIILTLGSVAIAMALAIGGHQVNDGGLAVGEVVMFLYYAQLFFAPVQDMSAWFAEMQMAHASAERVLSLVEAVPEILDSPRVAARIRGGQRRLSRSDRADRIRECRLSLSQRAANHPRIQSCRRAGRDDCPGRRHWRRQVDARQSAGPILRTHGGTHSHRRHRLSRAQPAVVSSEPGNRPAAAASLQPHDRRQYTLRPTRRHTAGDRGVGAVGRRIRSSWAFRTATTRKLARGATSSVLVKNSSSR